MAIPKIPKQHRDNITPISKDDLAERLLDDIEKKSSPAQAAKNKKPVPIYVKPELLKRIDKAAADMGVSRSLWLSFAAAEKLARDED